MSGDNQKMTKFEIYSNNCLLSVETLILLLFVVLGFWHYCLPWIKKKLYKGIYFGGG